MSNQFDAEHFHEPMYNAGLDMMRKLTSIAASPEHPCEDGIEGFTKFMRNYEPSDEFGELFPVEAETRYKATVIADIKPEIVYGSDLPPDYIVCALGSLSLALVDHLSYRRKGHGGSALFPPDPEWLKHQIDSLWMTRPEPGSGETEMLVMGTGLYPEIQLGLARAAGATDWSIQYTAIKRFAIVRPPSRNDPVLLIPSIPYESQSDLTDASDLTFATE